jgi:hypothetical protein
LYAADRNNHTPAKSSKELNLSFLWLDISETSVKKPPHPARLRFAALSREGRGYAVFIDELCLSSAESSPLPSWERADTEGGRVRGLFADLRGENS